MSQAFCCGLQFLQVNLDDRSFLISTVEIQTRRPSSMDKCSLINAQVHLPGAPTAVNDRTSRRRFCLPLDIILWGGLPTLSRFSSIIEQLVKVARPDVPGATGCLAVWFGILYLTLGTTRDAVVIHCFTPGLSQRCFFSGRPRYALGYMPLCDCVTFSLHRTPASCGISQVSDGIDHLGCTPVYNSSTQTITVQTVTDVDVIATLITLTAASRAGKLVALDVALI